MSDAGEQWVIATTFDSGDKAWWGQRRDRTYGLTPYRGNAARYDSREAALHAAYSLKEARAIHDFEVEMIPPKPKLKQAGQ